LAAASRSSSVTGNRADAALGADRELSIRCVRFRWSVAGRGDPLVDLEDLGLGPVHVEVLELENIGQGSRPPLTASPK